MTKNLTPAQIAVIEKMRSGSNLCKRHLTGGWYLSHVADGKVSSICANSLVLKGLVIFKEVAMMANIYTLTAKGREIELK